MLVAFVVVVFVTTTAAIILLVAFVVVIFVTTAAAIIMLVAFIMVIFVATAAIIVVVAFIVVIFVATTAAIIVLIAMIVVIVTTTAAAIVVLVAFIMVIFVATTAAIMVLIAMIAVIFVTTAAAIFVVLVVIFVPTTAAIFVVFVVFVMLAIITLVVILSMMLVVFAITMFTVITFWFGWRRWRWRLERDKISPTNCRESTDVILVNAASDLLCAPIVRDIGTFARIRAITFAVQVAPLLGGNRCRSCRTCIHYCSAETQREGIGTRSEHKRFFAQHDSTPKLLTDRCTLRTCPQVSSRQSLPQTLVQRRLRPASPGFLQRSSREPKSAHEDAVHPPGRTKTFTQQALRKN
ncbi:MAG: hypothetical protein ABJA10_04605 [Aestuariivirga sp.]